MSYNKIYRQYRGSNLAVFDEQSNSPFLDLTTALYKRPTMHQKFIMLFVLACLSIFISTSAISEIKDSIEPKLADQTKPMQQKLPDAQKEKPRGQLLYENHCGGCHETSVHGRDPRKATSISEIRNWINRWQKELKLNWSEAEVDDVTNYINFKYYHFAK